MSNSREVPVPIAVTKHYFLSGSVHKIVHNPMADKNRNNVARKKQCKVLIAKHGITNKAVKTQKKKKSCLNNKFTSIMPERFINKEEVYQLKKLLGAGGNGSVYSGIRMSDKLEVAIKIIVKNKIKQWGEINGQIVPIEFELLQMASQPEHQGIIKMLDWFKRQNNYILIMEHPKPALDLLQYINKHGAFSESLAKHVFKQLVKAVCDCHDKGVIHRDIKHGNVIFNLQTREAKIIDFGCGAKAKDTPFTKFAGTPAFYPPEWYIERKYEGQAVDCWSLGVLLYRMLETGLPFLKTQDIMRCSLKFKRPMTQACYDLIISMLQKENHKRPTLEEVLQHPWLSKDADC